MNTKRDCRVLNEKEFFNFIKSEGVTKLLKDGTGKLEIKFNCYEKPDVIGWALFFILPLDFLGSTPDNPPPIYRLRHIYKTKEQVLIKLNSYLQQDDFTITLEKKTYNIETNYPYIYY